MELFADKPAIAAAFHAKPEAIGVIRALTA